MSSLEYRPGHFEEDAERGIPVFVLGHSKEKPPPEALKSVADFLKRIEEQLFIDPRTAAENYLQELWEGVPGRPFPRDEVMAAIEELPPVKKLTQSF